MTDQTTTQFPPDCPHCGGQTVWQSDYMLSESGYLPLSDFDQDLDRVVHSFSCCHCDSLIEYLDLEDQGQIALLSCATPSPDDPDYFTTQYTPLANQYLHPT